MSDRIEIHPATDRWMAGDRFGSVIGYRKDKAGKEIYRVKMDRSGKTISVHEDNVGRWL